MKLTVLAAALALLTTAAAGTLRWTEPAAVWPDTVGNDTLVQGAPDVLAGTDSVLWVAWTQKKNGLREVKAARHDGGQWLTPETVVRFPPGENPVNIRLTLDRELTPWVVYDLTDRNSGTVILAYSHRTGGTWTDPEAIAKSQRGVHSPGLGAHPQGGVQVAWSQEEWWDVWLFTARGTADSWTTPVIIDEALAVMMMRSPAVAAINDSQVMVVWPATRDEIHRPLWSMVGSGDSWSEPIPVVFPPGGSEHPPRLTVTRAGPGARDARLFWYRTGGGIQTARYDGEQWVEHLQLDPAFTGYPAACTDEYGWTWVSYYHELGGYWRSFVRYHDGTDWSEPIQAFDTTYRIIALASAHGRIWATLTRRAENGNWNLLYYSSAGHPLAAAEPEQPGPRTRAGPTIVRGRLFLPRMTNDQYPMTMLDASGRKVMELVPGENDVRYLAPGVYFIRTEGSRGEPGTAPCRTRSSQGVEGSSAKVVIQR